MNTPMDRFKQLCIQLYNNSIIRYIFFGGLTTLVNLVAYYLLRQAVGLTINKANFIAICIAILFAYIVNSRFVFQSKPASLSEHFQEFLKFVGARISTMVIEMGGVWLLTWLGMNDMLGKFLVQFVVLALNYLFSKFFVFQNNQNKADKSSSSP